MITGKDKTIPIKSKTINVNNEKKKSKTNIMNKKKIYYKNSRNRSNLYYNNLTYVMINM